ncbi:phosphatidate cytidylyltransferase [Myxococcus stipitatus]|uniref:phosphatidate cytidylyltransferase n=1 Tax=Myxococcus stipitatus TaxID=83455 RepID=UPI001F3D9B10|nr:phosphatidate cytidylyltransferase [Myxococcus stipitatus]MCE9666749.1 phosphatidate cytidylyltransferase [Myxococcus stipitatus]
MNDKNRNLVVRIVTAVTLLPLVLLLLFLGGVWSAGLLGFAAAACVGEYYLIVQKRLTAASWVGMAFAAVMPFLPLKNAAGTGETAFWLTVVFAFFAWIYHLFKGPLAEAPTRTAHLVNGFLYGAVGLTALSALRLFPGTGLAWVICALTITWANDTAAYFFGRFLGRHKLYPEVSPNKTWEGFFGGMLGSVGGMFIARGFFFPVFTVWDCVLLGLAGGVLGPIGDLCESMLKRAYGVKDSGFLIPGHGGVLDRIDALLFNAPLVFVYVQFVRGLLP